MNIKCEITNEPERIRKADKLIIPGVEAFKHGINNLKQLGLIDVLNEIHTPRN